MKISPITENLCLRVINTKACRRVTVAALALLLSIPLLMAQEGAVPPSRSEALAAWDRGDYALAYEHYNGLLLLYSRDPLYKYYAGACLVKMEQDIPRAAELLGSSINSSVNVKSVPADVWFYYGRALQMSGSFAQAGEAYDRFARSAGRRIAAEYDVQSFIDQCSRGQGSIGSAVVSVTSKSVPAVGATSVKPEPATGATVSKPDPAAGAKVAKPGPGAGATVSKPDPVVIPGTAALPAVYESVMAEAVRLQHEADSILRTTGDTARAATLQARADTLFMSLEKPVTASSQRPVAIAAGAPDGMAAKALTLMAAGAPDDMAAGAPDDMAAGATAPAHLFSSFEVRPSPAYSERNPVPVDYAMPPGLVYTVQIAAFRNPVAPSLFRGLYPVFGGRRAGSEATYYYTGLFRKLEDARQALPGARGAGFTDAFVVAFMNGTQVSMERAGLLEKEWSSKPLPGKDRVVTAERKTSADPAAPVGTLSFRAEVMRVSKAVKPEVIERMELLAGTRGLEMIKNSSGETVFLIGNFITFESADDYVSLLIRNGYNTARVAAYVGLHEIPVEAAKELLNRLHDD